jgi:hypothetical protein
MAKKIEVKEREVSLNTIEYASSTAVSSTLEYPTPRELEPKYSVFRQPGAWWRQNYLSWRFYTTIYAGLGLLVTFTVLVGLVSAAAAHGVVQDRITLFEGSCASARLKGLFARGFISGMGTYMLSSSAYVMVRGIFQTFQTLPDKLVPDNR